MMYKALTFNLVLAIVLMLILVVQLINLPSKSLLTIEQTLCEEKIKKSLNKSIEVFPEFIRIHTKLRVDIEGKDLSLEIKIVPDEVLNGSVAQYYGVHREMIGCYHERKIYLTRLYRDWDVVHEVFHFLRDISGIVLEWEQEEDLANKFEDCVLLDRPICRVQEK